MKLSWKLDDFYSKYILMLRYNIQNNKKNTLYQILCSKILKVNNILLIKVIKFVLNLYFLI